MVFDESSVWILANESSVLSCDNLNMDSPRILDETPPVVHITYPANQSIVSGSVLVTAYAFDNNKLENVKLYIDDAIIFQGDTESINASQLDG